MRQDMVLGVDGGGTKTVAVVADAEGRVVGVGRGGPVNIGWVGAEAAARETQLAVGAALTAADVGPERIACAYLGMASVNTDAADDPERNVFMRAMQARGFTAERVVVDNDAFVGLASVIGGRPGVCVVAGTGFTAIAVGATGQRVRVPWYVGARAAGHILGRQAALAAWWELTGSGPVTVLTPKVLATLGVTDALALEDWLTERRPSSELGRLAPCVSAAAAEGDALAGEFLATAGRELGTAAVMVARAAGLDAQPVPVATIGGVFAAGETVLAAMRQVIAGAGLRATLQAPSVEPVAGALILAMQRAWDRAPEPERFAGVG